MKTIAIILVSLLMVLAIWLEIKREKKVKFETVLKSNELNCVLLQHTNYTILFDTVKKSPVWSQYQLTKNQVKPPKRSTFGYDPLLPNRLQIPNSSYMALNFFLDTRDKDVTIDRGHLSPYEDLGESSMLFTNISLQNSHFNENQWVQLEDFVRQLALSNDTLEVRTGVIFKDSVIDGYNIPVYYWKRVIIKRDIDTLIYKMPNRSDCGNFKEYLVKTLN